MTEEEKLRASTSASDAPRCGLTSARCEVREGISRFESENYEEQFEGVKVMGSVGSPSMDFAGSTMCRALNSRAPATKIARLAKEQEEVL